jgi:hypothetical protein
MVFQSFAAGGNRSCIEFWAIIGDPRYPRYRTPTESMCVGDDVADTGFILSVDPQPIATGFVIDVDPSSVDPEFILEYEAVFGDERVEDSAC